MPVSKRRNGRDQVVAAMRARGGVELGRAPTKSHRVRNGDGKPFPCVWADCWADGDTRYQVTENNPDAPDPNMPGGKIIRIFCSPRHRDLWYEDAKQMRRDQQTEQARLRRR